MPRREIPAVVPPPPPLPVRSEWIKEISFHVVTALFGGGAERSADEEDPFRVPSIRGHLRYWWRATAGGRFSSVEKLREAEAGIWGDTNHKSNVGIRILDAKRGRGQDAAWQGSDHWEKMEPTYALFPAQEDRRRTGKVYLGGSFRIEMTTSADMPARAMEEIESAIWAWVAFGGIGGRTRRGAGTLYSPQYPYSWKPEAFQGGGDARQWPILKGASAVYGKNPLPVNECWKKSIDLLKIFRQDRPAPRARSRWPEPDTVRELRHEHAANHGPVHRERGFPRAELGLPIIFHFKTAGDPAPNTLNVIDEDGKEARMASPVIVKPWAVSETHAIPLLLALNAPQPAEKFLVLRQSKPRVDDLCGGQDFHRSAGAIEKLIISAEDKWNNPRLQI